MPFDIASAIPVRENEKGAEELDFGFDISSARPVSFPEEATFNVLDRSNVWMDTAKALFRGVERIPAGIGSGIEFLGRDMVAETKSKTIPIVPFPGIKSIPWLRMPKGKNSKVGEAIDNFFIKFGDSLAEIGGTAKNFYNEAANKGIESPNPAVLMGWKHPFRKTISLAAENFPLLGIAAGVTAVTKSPTAGAATFFPAIAGDFYEEAVKKGVDPLRAADLAVIDGTVQTALETIPLAGWMRGGNIIKRVFRTALQEGLIEEGSQQIFENSLKILNWKEPRLLFDRITDGLAESILAGAVSGGALGVFEAPHIDDIRYDLHNQVINEGMKQGLTEEEISQAIDKVDQVIDKTIGVETEAGPALALKLKDGTVITDTQAKLHSDILTNQNVNPDAVENVGIIDEEGNYLAIKKGDWQGGEIIQENLPEVPKEVLDKTKNLVEESQPVAIPEESDLTEEDWLKNEGKEYEQLEDEASKLKKEKQTPEVKSRLEEINKRQGELQDQFIERKNKESSSEITKAIEEQGLRPITKEDFNQLNKPLPIDQIKVDEELLYKVNQLQVVLGKQITISSGYRTKEYNEDLKKRGYKPAENSVHLTGRAADIKITNTGLTHDEVVKAAQDLGLAVEDIEQTPYHVHVELPTEGSETPLMQAKKIAKAKIIKSVVSLLPEDVKKVEGMRKEIAAGEAGKRMPTESGQWIGIASTFPAYFRDKGYTKKNTLAIIDKVLSGKPITEKQQIVFNDLLFGFKEQAKQEAETYEERENDLRKGLVEKGFSGPEIEAIIREIHQRRQGEKGIEGAGDAGLSGSKLFKTPEEADEFITEIEDKGGQAQIVRTSSDEVEVSYILPEAQFSTLPSISPEEEKASVSGKLGITPKTVPPATATGKMEWEQNEAWKVNQGRDITGVFEREIGPKLQVSKRLKKWLGVYYPMLGPNGLIRVRSVADEKTLFHETGHFLDDVLGDYQISKKKAVRDELKAVSQAMRPFDPASVSKSYKSYRNSKPELFADYVAAYTMDPEICRRLAPNFTAEIENTIGKDKEWNYVISRLRDFEDAMKPLKEYVNALRKIPEIQPQLKEWAEKSNPWLIFYSEKTRDKVWDVYSKAIENLGKKMGIKALFEKGGLNDTVFEILRQRRKLIQGQQTRLKEELVDPVSKLSKEDQQYIAESLQRFGEAMQDTDLSKLTEAARQELAVWGNEARKLGLLNDEIFWNNVGQYFPFFYETKEFEKNKRNFGYFPSKTIRAKFESLKHKMTDEEFGRKVLEAQYGTWPSAKKKIAEYSQEELIELGRNAREELGLIKTAAYPLQKRLFGMIEMVYTVKAFNTIATLPGIIGHKGVEGFDKMPSGKKYGVLAGQYVPADLVKEVSKWGTMRNDLGEFWRDANTIWKIAKVPWNPAAISRNIITNSLMAWIGDVPVHNPTVVVKGVQSFATQDEAYKLLRDHGLYHNTYSEQEMKELAFQIDQDPGNPYTQLIKWGNSLLEAYRLPAKAYGAIEDASKTVIARYVLDQGGTPEEAVKFADKLLFDYSQTSEVVGYARQSFWPFITWSAKVLPRLVEFAIRKPEKYILMITAVGIWNAISRAMLGIGRDDEEKLKPDYIRGKSVLLLPGRDVNDDLNWIDLTYFLPWGSWLPIEKGDLSAPSVFNIGGPLVVLYNAYVLNHDPFYGEIAPDYLSKEQQAIEKGKYVARSLLPQILTTTPGKLIDSTKPDKYGRQREIGKILSGEFLGIKFTQDTSVYRSKIKRAVQQDFYRGRAKLRDQLKDGEITQEDYSRKVRKLQKKLREERESH
ncbi:MAG: D-Ala-D-Ala carboxypeptidase family metallohydrolase [Candidatus Omnitrophota bacterium]|jgi:uncharacterized protein YcbK (DUF882 family)